VLRLLLLLLLLAFPQVHSSAWYRVRATTLRRKCAILVKQRLTQKLLLLASRRWIFVNSSKTVRSFHAVAAWHPMYDVTAAAI
jgi:hypothetical protein